MEPLPLPSGITALIVVDNPLILYLWLALHRTYSIRH
jgi:hypothetical protein